MLTLAVGGLFATYATLLVGWHVLRRHLLRTVVGVDDIGLLAKERREGDKIDGTAVVCGGRWCWSNDSLSLLIIYSIAGMLAARICHAHFKKVLIIEPDKWTTSDEARTLKEWNHEPRRTRVLQYTSLHGNQAFLFESLIPLFPKFLAAAADARISILPHDPLFSSSGGLWRVPAAARRPLAYTSRATLERLIRCVVLDKTSYPNIEYMVGTVTDATPDPQDPTRLGHVVVRTEQGSAENIPAALVLDCTGTARAGMKWLGRHGYGAWEGKTIDHLKIALDQKLRYSTLIFKLGSRGDKFFDSLPIPHAFQAIKPILTFVEDANEVTLRRGRSLVVLLRTDVDTLFAFTGCYGDARAQPKNVDELLAYMHGLYTVEPIPDWIFEFVDRLREIEHTSLLSLVKVPPTTYVRYHLAENLPSNFVALGDSVMTVNPIFGEGCTKAMRCAMALHTTLFSAQKTSNTIPSTFSKDFFKLERQRTEYVWGEHSHPSSDYGALTTVPIEGESIAEGWFPRWYASKLQQLAIRDEKAGEAIYQTVAGFGTPIDALHPHLIAKVVWTALTGKNNS
ncbi:hypothetical protein MKEN_00744500 [Mycena kentingensis (nom. inval.)]|nr:hypothetical protein MKEN_00744500 [Mycena kentingensis (nom. inval.)]